MSSLHEELTLLAPAYALGALDADERRAFEAHVSTCAGVCGRSAIPGAHHLRPGADADAGLAPSRASRSGADGRWRVSVDASAPNRSGPSFVRRWPCGCRWQRRSCSRPALPCMPGTSATRSATWPGASSNPPRACAHRRKRSIEARRATAEAQAAIGVLTSPDVVRIDLKGQADAPQSSARAMWSRQRGMVFSGTNMPPLPAGRVYQVWVITDAGSSQRGPARGRRRRRVHDAGRHPPATAGGRHHRARWRRRRADDDPLPGPARRSRSQRATSPPSRGSARAACPAVPWRRAFPSPASRGCRDSSDCPSARGIRR